MGKERLKTGWDVGVGVSKVMGLSSNGVIVKVVQCKVYCTVELQSNRSSGPEGREGISPSGRDSVSLSTVERFSAGFYFSRCGKAHLLDR